MNDLIETASNAGLLGEVILSSLELMKEDPNLEPIKAFEISLDMWECYEE